MSRTLEAVSLRTLNIALLVFGIGTVALLWVLSRPSDQFTGRRINDVLHPFPSELTPLQVASVHSWLLVDCVFAPVYTIFFAFLTLKVNRASSGGIAPLGKVVFWVIVFAVVFDLGENFLLWKKSNEPGMGFEIPLRILGVLKWTGPTLGGLYFALATIPKIFR